MQKLIIHVIWGIPLVLHSADACAWGLYTHVFFAQALIWATPLIDSRFRQAMTRLPKLLLAGACLPDLSLVGRLAGTSAFASTHRWEQAHTLLSGASSDTERALALGYTCHLFVDIVAHNHFVPAHREMWMDVPMITHAFSEWAMDAHVGPHVYHPPRKLLQEASGTLAQYVSGRFKCTPGQAKRALGLLARGDGVLRISRLPESCYLGARAADFGVAKRFDYFIRETGKKLLQINRIIAGEEPQWHPEPAQEEQNFNENSELTRSREGIKRMKVPQDLIQRCSAMGSIKEPDEEVAVE